MTYIETLGIKAQQAKKGMMKLGTQQKNDALLAVAQGDRKSTRLNSSHA